VAVKSANLQRCHRQSGCGRLWPSRCHDCDTVSSQSPACAAALPREPPAKAPAGWAAENSHRHRGLVPATIDARLSERPLAAARTPGRPAPLAPQRCQRARVSCVKRHAAILAAPLRAWRRQSAGTRRAPATPGTHHRGPAPTTRAGTSTRQTPLARRPWWQAGAWSLTKLTSFKNGPTKS
jgi:hypothetical protein